MFICLWVCCSLHEVDAYEPLKFCGDTEDDLSHPILPFSTV